MQEREKVFRAVEKLMIRGSGKKMPEGIRSFDGLTKADVLERILKDQSRVVKVIPIGGYGDKMQTIRTNKVEA